MTSKSSANIPSKRAPNPPFLDTKKWNKTYTIVTKEYEKTRIQVKWLFVMNNQPHNALLTHSQKRNPLLPSSRTLWIDGIKIHSNRCTNNIFTTIVDDNKLKFKIEYIGNEYRYSMSINNIPHQIAYRKWMCEIVNCLQTLDGFDSYNMDLKKEKQKKKNKLPTYRSLADSSHSCIDRIHALI
eukprot:522127_1